MKMNEYQAAQILGLTGEINNADIKRAYRQKAGQYHPDKNPAGAEMMKLINEAYSLLKNIEVLNVWENEILSDYPEILSQALNSIRGLYGLHVEICGLWVWVSGKINTNKSKLENAGFKYMKDKNMYYFRPETAKSKKNAKPWEMAKIRKNYGNTIFKRRYGITKSYTAYGI